MEIKSLNKEVQKFIKSIELVDRNKFEILQKVRKILFSLYPNVKEKFMYGGIIFNLEEDFAGVFVYSKHVSVEFSQGVQFEDPGNLLEGKGKFRRHLKLNTKEQIESKNLEFFLQQGVEKIE